MSTFIQVTNFIVLVYFFLLNTVYLTTSLFAFWSLRQYRRKKRNINIEDENAAKAALPIALIVPAHNEELTGVQSVQSLLSLIYPEFEVIVVNDGSADGTLRRLTEAFDMVPSPRFPMASIPCAPVRETYRSRKHPQLWLIDKENGGKADALNCGLNYARAPLFCAIDSDSLLEREALKRIVRPFLEDNKTIASGGIIRIVNGCSVRSGVVTDVRMPKNWLAKFQVLEYLRAVLSGRIGWSALNSILVISGAFGLFRRGIVIDCGGFDKNTVGEDMELIMRLHRHCRDKKIPYKITYIPDPVAWTECPETLAVLGRQRDRWQRGLAESLVKHRAYMFNPRYGRLGLIAYPYFFFLELLGPTIETMGYISFILCLLFSRISVEFMAAFLIAAFIFGMILSIIAVSLEELSFQRYPRLRDIGQLFFLAIAENVGYRQILSYYRVKSIFTMFRRSGEWGKMQRKGFAETTR